MPDVGGLVLVVCALRLAERLARLLALREGHDARVSAMTRRVALALALTLYAMFAFRRWYAFAGVGIVVMLALEVLAIALRRGARFRSSDAIAAVALGLLALLALLSPVLVDWAPSLARTTMPEPTPATASPGPCSWVSSATGSASSPRWPHWPARRFFGLVRATGALCALCSAAPPSPQR